MSYFYIFPLANGEANVGYGMVSEVAAKGRHNLRDIFQKLIEEDPVMAPRFQNAEPLEAPVGWGIPLASRRRRAFGDGYLLAGDAASLVCPTSGEGIGTGMISGFIAAQFAQKALKNKRFDSEQFKNYDREIYRRLHSEIRLYKLMMAVSPKIYDFGLNLLAPNSLFQRSFHRRVGGWLKTAYERPIKVRF
jgi:flavin-dependent dehydrogenase